MTAAALLKCEKKLKDSQEKLDEDQDCLKLELQCMQDNLQQLQSDLTKLQKENVCHLCILKTKQKLPIFFPVFFLCGIYQKTDFFFLRLTYLVDAKKNFV